MTKATEKIPLVRRGIFHILCTMEELLRTHLLQLAEVYKSATGLPFSKIGRRMLHDSSFFKRIGEGDGFNVKTFDKAVAWFSANWPSDVAWPSDVDRPADAERAA